MRKFKSEGGYEVYNAFDSHPSLCNLESTGDVKLFGTHDGITWEQEGIWVKNEARQTYDLVWLA